MARLAIVYVVVLATLRLTLASPEGCDAPSPDALERTASRAASWLAEHQRTDGSFLYESDRDGEDLGGYNEVRHAGVLLSLYQSGELDAADRGLEWAIDHLEDVEDGAALALHDRASVGGAALLTAALAERRVQTGEDDHDDLLRDLGSFLVSMQRDDGGFYVSVAPSSGALDRQGTSRYYPGEALWALARLENLFPGEDWDVPARRAAAFIATRRDDVEDVIAPPLNDHWAAYGFAEMATWTTPGVDDDVADYARLLYGRFALLIRTESRRDAALIGMLHGPPRRSSAVGTWVEGQAALARLAALDERVADLEDRIIDSARCGTGVLVDRQEPNGAWYARGATRMDDQQHAISGLLATAVLP
ncbi:MAG TPA: hypothetical protein VFU93_01540 [Acidimicrobiales bacterium]|nr:hypothetical protein [Acidimicrobiales bacterium]